MAQMPKYFTYIPFIVGAVGGVITLLAYMKDREELKMDREKHTLQQELTSLQIKSLKQKLAA